MKEIDNSQIISSKKTFPRVNGVTARQIPVYQYVFSDEDVKKMSQMKYTEDKLSYKQDLILKNKFKIKVVETSKPELQTQITVQQGDITKLKLDAIVNAANTSLLGGGGVDGAIHKAAGPELLEECKMLKGCNPGCAKITNGYNIPSNYIIHAVGPVWKGGKNNEAETLKNCYLSILNLAKEYKLKEIAIPAISCGAYGYPLKEAVKIAVDTVKEFVDKNKCLKTIVFIDINGSIINEYKKYLRI